MPRRAIGLLGGSFNPAHDGHLRISRLALGRLGLDQVWWLISPQNPLKSEVGMAPFAARLAAARELASDPRLVVSDFEARANTRYTLDTIRALRRRHPGEDFVWLIGADNLIQLPSWHNWTQLMAEIPIAVIDRPGYTHAALAGLAARRHAARRRPPRPGFARRRPPAWCFIFGPRSPHSASAIRAGK